VKFVFRLLLCLQLPLSLSAGTAAMIRATGSTAQTESEESPTQPTESESSTATAQRRSEDPESRTLAARCTARADCCPRLRSRSGPQRALAIEGHRWANGLNAPMRT
jgi:hypothetical protein